MSIKTLARRKSSWSSSEALNKISDGDGVPLRGVPDGGTISSINEDRSPAMTFKL